MSIVVTVPFVEAYNIHLYITCTVQHELPTIIVHVLSIPNYRFYNQCVTCVLRSYDNTTNLNNQTSLACLYKIYYYDQLDVDVSLSTHLASCLRGKEMHS